MLPERYCQLLTAYLDGELSPRRRKTALRLLRRSARARSLFRKLQSDSQRLRALPQPVPALDLSPRVLHAIAQQGLRPGPLADSAVAAAAPPAASALPGWLGLAVAASLLLAITGLSYLFFSGLQAGDQIEQVVEQQPAPEVAPKKGPPPEEPGLKVALRGLGSQGERKRLTQELRKETSYRLSLACRDSLQAVERLQRALRTRGVQLVMDRGARERVRRKEHNTTYLFYAENLEADELTALLHHLGVVAKGSAQEPPCESAVVSALTSAHRRDLAQLLGVSAENLAAPARALPAKDVPMPPLDTIIEGPPAEKAKTAEPPRKVPLPPARLALVLAADAVGPAGPGSEIQRFLQRRPPQRPGTLQVLLVLHDVRA
jgi:hypothetical protein